MNRVENNHTQREREREREKREKRERERREREREEREITCHRVLFHLAVGIAVTGGTLGGQLSIAQ